MTVLVGMSLDEAVARGVERMLAGEEALIVASSLADELDEESRTRAAVHGLTQLIGAQRHIMRGREAEGLHGSENQAGSRPRIPQPRNVSAREYFAKLEYTVDGKSRSLIDCSIDDLGFLFDLFKARETAFRKRRMFLALAQKACRDHKVDKVRDLPDDVLTELAAKAAEVW